MTKEEKIKEAWGEYYEINKELIDCKGWLRCCSKTDINTLNFIEENKDNFDDLVCNTPDAFLVFHRPKSLQGIENNNGWIKIDFNNLILPADGTEVNFYHQFINENGNQIEYHKGIFNSALGFTSYYDSENYKINEITHYQPIEKPKPPIY